MTVRHKINGSSSLSVFSLKWMWMDVLGLWPNSSNLGETNQTRKSRDKRQTKKQLLCVHAELLLPSVLGRCWLGIRKSIGPAKN